MTSFGDYDKLVRRSEPLGMHTWLRVGGPAEYFAQPTDREQLAGLLAACREQGIAFRVLGSGSNVLVRDEGVPGLVINITEPAFSGIEVDGTRIRAEGGARLGRVVTTAVHEGLGGMEPLIGIPGVVGGAVRRNTTTAATSMGQWIDQLVVMNESGEIFESSSEEMLYSEDGAGLDATIILEAVFSLEEDDPVDLAKRLQKQWILCKASQPMGHQCAGRIFRDPPEGRASRLIEDAGLKGTRIGGAVVSDRSANFVVAEPECTSADVLRLIDIVRGQVEQRTGVSLVPAIEVW